MSQQRGRLRPDAPLGVFDSGLGGLTVVRALREHCPHENIIYLCWFLLQRLCTQSIHRKIDKLVYLEIEETHKYTN